MTTARVMSLSLCACVFAALGCSKDKQAEETAEVEAITQGGEREPSATMYPERQREAAAAKAAAEAKPAGMPLSDSEIVRITDAVNGGEIEQAEVARTKASASQVVQFAEQMIAEHRQAKQKGRELVQQLGIVPEESSIATELSNESTRAVEKLQGAAPGSGFDELYIQSQVKQHAEVLDMIETKLIPSAEHPELVTELQKARGMIARHLEHARKIEREMAR